MRSAPLRTVRTPPATAVEARRGPAEGAAAAREAGRRAAAGGACGGVAATWGRGGLLRGGVQAQDVTVVLGTRGGVREDTIGFRDAHETPRGVWVGAVVVWVVGFGEPVEGPGEGGPGGPMVSFCSGGARMR